jgi:hypothetical protein
MKRFNTSHILKIFCIVCLVVISMPLVSSNAFAGLMHYYTVEEAEDKLRDLARSDHARLVRIGYSYDYSVSVVAPDRYPVYALRVSAEVDSGGDNYEKNSILFECGTHPREWLAIESCMRLAEHLVENADNSEDGTDFAVAVRELLEQVDVWIIPMSNPSGRMLDSEDGDPTSFYTSSTNSGGWRGNGDTRLCPDYGVNVARNFSRGWNDTSARPLCNNRDEYRGFAPFSTAEASNLREFVLNHSISMAVVVHTTGHHIYNRWGDDDKAGRGMALVGANVWRSGFSVHQDKIDYDLERLGIGGGNGQFSAWLARSSTRSDTAGVAEPDKNSLRAIQTFYLELPVNGNSLYSGSPYEDSPGDGSNRFHPSSDNVLDLIEDNFIPMSKFLIQQSRSPGCLTFWDEPVPLFCYRYDSRHSYERDLGIVAAKISRVGYEDEAGSLRSIPAEMDSSGAITPAYVYLPYGNYNLVYRVQSFTTGYQHAQVDITVKIKPSSCTSLPCSEITNTYTQYFFWLSIQEADAGIFRLGYVSPNSEYTVKVNVHPYGAKKDSFSSNNKKVFKFKTGHMTMRSTRTTTSKTYTMFQATSPLDR